MNQIEEDVGIGVDYDQCLIEKEYYEQCARLQPDERADSAVCLSSTRTNSFPAVLQTLNGSRKKNSLNSFRNENVRALVQIRKEISETKNEEYLINSQMLVTELIDFVDVPFKHSMKRRLCLNREQPPMFSLSDDGLEVNHTYYFDPSSPYALMQNSYLRILGERLVKHVRKLSRIVNFVESVEEKKPTDVPLIVLILKDWSLEFLRDHTIRLEGLRCKRLTDPCQALANLQQHCRNIDVVWNAVGADASKNVWMWEDVETTWNRVWLINETESVVSQNEIVRKLQQKWIYALLKIMDNVFEMGRVPEDIGLFVLQNDDEADKDLLLCRDINKVHSVLWDDELVEIVLTAAQSRIRLGEFDIPSRTFSRKFYEIVDEEKLNERFLSFYEFRWMFKKCCEVLRDEMGIEIFGRLNERNFERLWLDLENVVVGDVAQKYNATMFRSDTEAVVDSSSAFWLAAREYLSEENLMRIYWMSNKSEFSLNLDPFLSYFIKDELINVMNQCMKYANSIYRTREVLVTMANDKEMTSRLTIGPTEAHNRAVRTRLRLFVFGLEKVVSYFNEMFEYKVREVFRTKRMMMINGRSVKDFERAFKETQLELNILVERTGIRKFVHEATDEFKLITDDIRLKSVSNVLTIEYLVNCEKKLTKILSRLKEFAKGYGSEKDNVFYLLSVRIGELR